MAPISLPCNRLVWFVHLRNADIFGSVAQVPADVVPLIKNQRELSLQITAAIICGLEPVNSFTKIVVMDSSGTQSKDIARAISSAGYRGYVAIGGYEAWTAADLYVKFANSYDVTAG